MFLRQMLFFIDCVFYTIVFGKQFFLFMFGKPWLCFIWWIYA